MAITKTIDIDVNSSNAEKNISKLNGNLTNLSDATVKVKDASKEFGLISEGTAQTLDKVQSVTETAVSTYKSFSSVLKSFGIIQKITTAAQYVWNAAMAANPIGALVAVVVALVSAGYALVRMFQASSAAAQASADANKKLNQQLQTQVELQKKLLIETELQRDSALKMAKASGASAKEIRKLSEELANQEVAQKVANAETLRAIFLEARRVAGLKDSTDAEKATAKAAFKAFEDANNQAEQAILNRRKLAINNRVEERQEQTDANKKAQEEEAKHLKELQDAEKAKIEEKLKDTKLSFDKQRELVNNDNNLSLKDKKDFLKKINDEERKSIEEHKKALIDLENKYTADIENLKATTDQQKLDLQKSRDLKELENVVKTEEEKAKLKTSLDEKYKILQSQLDDKNAKDKIAKEDAQFLKLQELTLAKADFEKLQLVQKYEAEYIAAEGNAELQLALKEKLSADIKAIDDKEANNKKILKEQELAIVGETFGKIADLAGKNSKIGKAFAVGQALINTYQGITAQISTKPKTPYEIGLVIANVATVAATGFSAVKKILATNPMSSSGASTSSGGNSSSGGASSAPQFNLVGQSSTNQLSQTIANQQKQPIKTYVVAGDVTSAQSADRNAVQTSTFGG